MHAPKHNGTRQYREVLAADSETTHLVVVVRCTLLYRGTPRRMTVDTPIPVRRVAMCGGFCVPISRVCGCACTRWGLQRLHPAVEVLSVVRSRRYMYTLFVCSVFCYVLMLTFCISSV